ncbi:tRNA 2-thiocytidine(32) synthetase TtcA [Paraliomyxa miuraensis]|uniref:tRNA 2-thiocytidine(32) synthetase TtcA n=1 Tax=Paraliomyxa miuraensis TaxID=376150 RepID=UPI00224DC947|nr:tRNA 2-thiocytidine(32) synthetase TtcA [Paraliomyxa miuraensis]MCX4247298.1 tRNA 2-thiocytidine(32) synthetase TtcA [Paraliomyxa miuraensis]
MSAIRKRLARTMTRTIAAHGLVEAGDHVMVAVSGGKDSYTLLDLLWEARRKAPFRFDVTAVHLDQGQPGYDGTPLRRWLAAFGAPFEIVSVDTYSTVVRVTPEGKSFCGACSRMRRGILYTTAARLRCNKIALGHHRDDALETLLLNLFYAGKLQAMPAGYTTDDGRFGVIRPLIECPEPDIVEHAREVGYPILPCNLCGSQDGLRRERMGALMSELERDNPHVRSVMLNALRNVQPSHLLDPAVRRIDDGLGHGPRGSLGTNPESDPAPSPTSPERPEPSDRPSDRPPVRLPVIEPLR